MIKLTLLYSTKSKPPNLQNQSDKKIGYNNQSCHYDFGRGLYHNKNKKQIIINKISILFTEALKIVMNAAIEITAIGELTKETVRISAFEDICPKIKMPVIVIPIA